MRSVHVLTPKSTFPNRLLLVLNTTLIGVHTSDGWRQYSNTPVVVVLEQATQPQDWLSVQTGRDEPRLEGAFLPPSALFDIPTHPHSGPHARLIGMCDRSPGMRVRSPGTLLWYTRSRPGALTRGGGAAALVRAGRGGHAYVLHDTQRRRLQGLCRHQRCVHTCASEDIVSQRRRSKTRRGRRAHTIAHSCSEYPSSPDH